MDILLINPPRYRESGNIWKHVSACLPSFGLANLASLAREKGFSVSILDCDALHVGVDKIGNFLPIETPRFVGVTATTVTFNNALSVAEEVKRKYPSVKTIFGGVHPTVRPEETLDYEQVDFIAIGEGELCFLDLLSGQNPEEIKGIGFKKNGQQIINSISETIPDINIFPLPAYDLLPMERYRAAAGSFKRKPSFGMITSRGCPGRCTFCKGNLLGDRIRFRSATKVVEEIELLQKEYGIKDITFYDDTFTSDKRRVKEICSLVVSKKIDLTWCCFSRIDTVDCETLIAMKRAGCYQVMYGVESASPEILQNIKKRITLDKVKDTVFNTKKAGLETRLAFMVGNPGETEETIKKTINFAIQLDPDLVSFNIATPYPGTEMFEWAEENGYLIHRNWAEYDLANPVMNLPTIDTKKVLFYYKKAHYQFYFRFSYILKRLMKIRSTEDIARNFGAFFSLLGFSFEK